MRLILLVFIFLTSGLSFAQKLDDTNQKLKEFEAYIIKSQKDWEIPGLAVTVVKDGKVLLSKGFGVRELDKPELVDNQTMYACASTTKAMTATCMGILVDEGKVKWDDHVQDYLPEFQLYDPYVTRELTIRDLFLHRTGVAATDYLWTWMGISSDEMLEKMRDAKPSYSFRSNYRYQNIFYLAAGKVIEKVSGKPWEEFIAERIFNPLGMKSTVPLQSQLTSSNRSTPHDRIEGKITPIRDTNADKIGPAGSVWSNVDDMSKWVICMLDSSKFNGGRLLSKRTWTEMFTPQLIIPRERFYASSQLTKPNWTTYGLGWFQHDYKGKKVNFHTGSLAGTVAIHGQLPEAKLGIYVYGNFENGELRHALLYKAFDLFALGGNLDYSTELLKIYKASWAQSEKQERAFDAKRVPNTKPSYSLEKYAGKYSDPIYGEIEITVDGGTLNASLNNYVKASFTHWHFDTFRGWCEKRWYGKANLTFSLGADGSITKVNFWDVDFKKVK